MGALLFILVVSGLYQPFFKPPQVNAAVIPRKPPTEEVIITSGTPARLRIPAINMDRDLLDGGYSPATNSWTLSSRGVHYATASAPANDYGGSTFIYGHNNKNVFGPLKNVGEGDIAEIVTDNDLVFTYKFHKRDTLQPTDTSPLTYQASPRLTLQTCTGNWNQLREMFYFELVDITDISPVATVSEQVKKVSTLAYASNGSGMEILQELSRQ